MLRKKRVREREFFQRERDKKVRLDPGLKKIFSLIGVPGGGEFIPDPFQLQAIELIKESDVLVSAPTGAGKTWIATQVIRDYLGQNRRVWYGTPLKALSNSIYEIFQGEFGLDRCGILTGDRKENPDAPIIVGTTEILRNQLYDAMYRGEDLRCDLVILDEAHYMNDAERGVVWEEVMIYLPTRIRLVLLSATISNSDELARWLEEVRGGQVRVVKATKRPVPLMLIYYDPNGLVLPLTTKKGLSQRVAKIDQDREMKRLRPNYGDLIKDMRALNLLPAIFFLKSREDCDRAIYQCPETSGDKEIKERMKRDIEEFLTFHPHLTNHRQLEKVLSSRVASHHAGQLPSWKLFVERMMNQGYLEAIFATSTVAAGVNFPARTVVLFQSDRFNGRGFVPLTSTEFHQMIGRAGRRGKDTIGFAMVVPGIHQDIEHIYGLSKSQPEPIRSQLKINFSMVLNLLLSHTPSEVKYLLERSFMTYKQAKDFRDDPGLGHWIKKLEETVKGGRCDASNPFEIREAFLRYRTLKKDLEDLRWQAMERVFTSNLRGLFSKGRLIGHRNGGMYVVLHQYTLHKVPQLTCLRVNTGQRKKVRGEKISKVRLQDVTKVYDYTQEDLTDMEKVNQEIMRLLPGIKELDLKEFMDEDLLLRVRNRELAFYQTPCYGCLNRNLCHGRHRSELGHILNLLDEFKERLGLKREEIWFSFEKHLMFLKDTGFVDQENRLSHDGFWASKLRLDYPLLIAELIRKKTIIGTEPELVAAALAPFVWDRSQEVFLRTKGRFDITRYESLYERILEDLLDILDRLETKGFPIPQIPFWPGVAVYAWAKGMSWEGLMSMVKADEGDVASLVVRTVDHLRQVSGLKDSHPELAFASERAIQLLMREPIYLEQTEE